MCEKNIQIWWRGKVAALVYTGLLYEKTAIVGINWYVCMCILKGLNRPSSRMICVASQLHINITSNHIILFPKSSKYFSLITPQSIY